MISVETITSQALLLPIDQRLALAHQLLLSADPGSDPKAHEEWDREIRKRMAGFDANQATGIDGDSVFAELDRRLGR
jgi:hypothetical protein